MGNVDLVLATPLAGLVLGWLLGRPKRWWGWLLGMAVLTAGHDLMPAIHDIAGEVTCEDPRQGCDLEGGAVLIPWAIVIGVLLVGWLDARRATSEPSVVLGGGAAMAASFTPPLLAIGGLVVSSLAVDRPVAETFAVSRLLLLVCVVVAAGVVGRAAFWPGRTADTDFAALTVVLSGFLVFGGTWRSRAPAWPAQGSRPSWCRWRSCRSRRRQ